MAQTSTKAIIKDATVLQTVSEQDENREHREISYTDDTDDTDSPFVLTLLT